MSNIIVTAIKWAIVFSPVVGAVWSIIGFSHL